MSADGTKDEGPGNFIRDLVQEEFRSGGRTRLRTRFPPEPNGYLHIGHAKAIVLNFSLAQEFGGICNLRFDDTNPEAEETEFVRAMRRDIAWLGYEWGDNEFFASDYFEQLYEWAVRLIEAGKAYVDDQSLDEIRAGRGNFHKPGVESPFRERSVEENLDLFTRMRAGEFEEGTRVLRAKIDMQSKDLKLRDPLMYRIRKAPHHRTGDSWCIYPIYDWAHGQSDAIEGVTHSLCSLEFQNHRPLYEWFLAELGIEEPPRQIEFARLNLSFTVLSKRKLRELVTSGLVDGWDDPRMPTLSALRRRGYPAKAIRDFCDRVGVSRQVGVVDVGLLEYTVREALNETSPRVMAVIDPLRVVLENFPEDRVDWFECSHHPEDDRFGTRKVPFTRELYVEREDYMDDPPKKWFRLGPDREVRLRYAALVTVKEVIRDESGKPIELRCWWDPESSGGNASDGRRVRGTLHWVSATHAVDAEVRLYDRLFTDPHPDGDDETDFKGYLNPDARMIRPQAKLEPSLASVSPGHAVQFERLGYFVSDLVDHRPDRPVFNRTISLKDSWAKIAKRLQSR